MSLRSIHCSHYRCAQIAITPCYALRIIHCVHSLLVAALLFVLLRCFATLIRSCLFATLTCRTLVLHVRSNCIATLLRYAHPLLLVRSFALTIVLRTQVFALVNRCAVSMSARTSLAMSSLRLSTLRAKALETRARDGPKGPHVWPILGAKLRMYVPDEP
jgi:hypothetical protein